MNYVIRETRFRKFVVQERWWIFLIHEYGYYHKTLDSAKKAAKRIKEDKLLKDKYHDV